MWPAPFVAFVALGLPVLPAPALVARIGSPAFRQPADAYLCGISADGKRVYTTQPAPLNSEKADLFIWDADAGRLLARHPLGRAEDRILHIGFGPDGIRVFGRVGGGADYQLRVVNPDSGETTHTGVAWKEPPTELNADGTSSILLNWFNFSHDGAWMIRGGKTQYRLFNTATGLETAIDVGAQAAGFGERCHFSPDGKLCCVATERAIRLHALPGGKLLGELTSPGDQLLPAEFTPDAKSLAVWVRKGRSWSLQLHDLAGKTRQRVLDRQSVPGRIFFAVDGKTFARVPMQDGAYPAGDWEVRDTATGREIARIPAERYPGRALFSPDGKTLYTQPHARSLIPWDVATGRPKANAPAPLGAVDRFRFTPDGKLVGLAGGFVYTWDPATGKELARARMSRTVDWYGGATFDPASRLVYTDIDEHLVSWEFRTGAEQRNRLELRKQRNTAIDMRFSPDGARHIEYKGGTLYIRDPATAKEVAQVSVPEVWRPRGAPAGI